MRTRVAVFTLTFGTLALVCGADPPPPAPEAKPAPLLVPDKGWVPLIGDRATVRVTTTGCASLGDLQQFLKFRIARDDAGMKTFQGRSGPVVTLPAGTGVLVIKRYDYRGFSFEYQHDPEGRSDMAVQAELNGPKSEYLPNVLEVRVLDGAQKDQLRLVYEGDIARLIPAPEPTRENAKPPPRQVAPADRAAGLLRSAESLAKAGHTAGAMSLYRGIVRDFPGTPAAEEAALRIRKK